MSNVTWSVHNGVLTNNQLNKTFQREAQPMNRFRQFVKFKSAFGKGVGQTENWLKVSNAGPAAGTATYGGQLTETNTMFEAGQPLTLGTVTVEEYGMAIPMTFKVQSLSEFDVMTIVRESLLDDSVKVIDGVIERQFNATLLRYVGITTATSSVTTNGTATVTNTSALGANGGYHVRKMVLELKKRNVPGFQRLGGDYGAILSHEAAESLVGGLVSVNQYTTQGYEKLLNGEQGRWHGTRFVEDGFATRFVYSATGRTATAASNFDTKGLSGNGYVFGSPTVREIVAVPEHIRAKVVTDYGRSHGLGWYMIGGWKIEWDTSGGADSRIIKWDSKA
jgi:hypothetical protein